MKKKRAVAGGLLLVLGIGTERISRNHDRNVSCGSVLYGAGSGKHHDSI